MPCVVSAFASIVASAANAEVSFVVLAVLVAYCHLPPKLTKAFVSDPVASIAAPFVWPVRAARFESAAPLAY